MYVCMNKCIYVCMYVYCFYAEYSFIAIVVYIRLFGPV